MDQSSARLLEPSSALIFLGIGISGSSSSLAAPSKLYTSFLSRKTRATILVEREAKKRRKAGETNIYGPAELKGHGLSMKEVLAIWIRPFDMFIHEPIVLWLSLLSGFSDALIFTFLESFQPVYKQWGFGTVQVGLAFIP